MRHKIKENMEIVGADGGHVGIVDRVGADHIKLKKRDNGDVTRKRHRHYIETGFVARVTDHKVHLTVNADLAVTLEEEKYR